ncbi:exostosin family protein [Actinidia rufa]|uniref:Exostosin family protein n=1 Tax=Actinidia rufa TaxID=165716 RepID=A0A7J0G346_9ERIC|nr:exostosin family protein [Actinidia rufa]
MWLPNRPRLAYSIKVWVLLLGGPLVVISLVDFTLGPHRSWISLRVGSLGGSYSLSVKEELERPFSLGEVAQAPMGSSMEQKSSPKSPYEVSAGEIKRFTRLDRLEAALAKARHSIREAAQIRNMTSIHEDSDYVPQGPMYRNANAFHRSYLEMEKLFKIYVYDEGEPPIFHNGPCRSIYSTEGRFIMEMEKGNFYRTKDPDEALVFFLPFSVVNDGSISLRARCPRVPCYRPHCCRLHRHCFPETSLLEPEPRTGEITGLLGGPSPSRRPILAFFAGRLHGHIRYLLLEQWKEKDDDVQVYDNLPNDASYESMLKKSRFCLCPSGYEVASPRVIEAIYAECVPVLISDGYVPPLSDVLNWKAFSVSVAVKDIPNLKRILMGISQSQYLRMHRRVKQVQRHFVINGPPKRFDIFHMTVHSIWLRRLNVLIHD